MRPEETFRARRRAAAALAAAAVALAPGAAAPQEGGAGGVRLTFGFDTLLRAGTDFGGDEEVELETDLAFRAQSVTRVRSAVLSLGAEHVADLLGDDEGNPTGLTERRASLAYRREAAGGGFALDASVTEVELGDFVLGTELLEPGDLFLDDDVLELTRGTRRTSRASFELLLLQDRPIAIALSGSGRVVDYDGAPADAEESTAGRLAAAARLRLTPVLAGTAQLSGELVETEDPDPSRRETARLSFGLFYAASDRLELRASVGGARTEFEDDDEDDTSTEATAALGAALALPRGAVSIGFDQDLVGGDLRRAVTVGRTLELTDDDRFAFRVGASQGEDEDLSTVGAVDWTRTGARSALSVGFERSVDARIDGGTAVRTELSAGYRRALTALASLQLAADYARVDDDNDDDLDERGAVRATLSRQITEDWSAFAGVERRLRDDETADSLFVGIGRSFEGRY